MDGPCTLNRLGCNRDQLERRIVNCVWREVFEKAQRLHIVKDIARNICCNEGAGWAAEFEATFDFDLNCSLCGGGDCCRFVFRRESEPTTGLA